MTVDFPQETTDFQKQWGRARTQLTAQDQAFLQMIQGTDFSGGDYIMRRTGKTDNLLRHVNLSAVAFAVMSKPLPRTDFGDPRLSTMIKLLQKLHPALQESMDFEARKEASKTMLAGLHGVATLCRRPDCLGQIVAYNDFIFVDPARLGAMNTQLYGGAASSETRDKIRAEQAAARERDRMTKEKWAQGKQGRPSDAHKAFSAAGQASTQDKRPEERRHHATFMRHEGGAQLEQGVLSQLHMPPSAQTPNPWAVGQTLSGRRENTRFGTRGQTTYSLRLKRKARDPG